MDSRQVMALAAGAARRGLAIKVGLPLGAALMAFLILVGMMAGFGGGSASAAGCEQPGLPADDGEYGNGQSGGDARGGADKELRSRQVAHAKIIDEVAKEGKLPGRATLIALMTGLAESQLENLKGGDRDSVGIFQQRPSTGWGTPAQINDIKYATRMFLFGGDSGDPPGLTDISWESLSLNDAAQKVQRSGFPNAYGPKETQARSIAKEAGIDLDRAGENHPGQPGRNGSNGGGGDRKDDGKGNNDPDEPQDCEQQGSGKPGKPGEPFHDGNAGWPNGVKNPLSTADAIRKARAEADSHRSQWYQKCLAFTSIMYGWSFSGTNYAIDHYQVEMPKDMRHDGDRNPPPGALMFWDTGHRAGHVAIYLGDGKIASNDIVTPGEISVVPATDIETKWSAKYLGWSPPYYPKGG